MLKFNKFFFCLVFFPENRQKIINFSIVHESAEWEKHLNLFLFTLLRKKCQFKTTNKILLKLIRSTIAAASPIFARTFDRIMGSTTVVNTQVDIVPEDTTVTIIRLEDIKSLCNDHCKMKDPARVERILNEFVKGGPERLQLVSDFDYTITKQRTADGSPVLSSFGIFNACQSLPKSFIEESMRLHQKYRPIEIDPHISINEKIQYMIDWWTKSGQLLVGFPFDQTEIDNIAVKYKDALRDHTHTLFQNLNRLDIPVLVFSAGLGNSVVSVLKQANIMYSNVKVISNFLQYKDGMLNGFQEPMIHTFNKNETALNGSEYYDLVHNRDHIIVMGDSIGDADMANGVPSSSHVIKIGFLFDHPEHNLEKYMNAFDIVLIDDQTMDVPLALLTAIENYQLTDDSNTPKA